MWDAVAMWLVALVVILVSATLRARSLRTVNPVPRPRPIDVAVPKPPPRRAAENDHPRQQRRRAIIERPLPELEPVAPPPVTQVRSRSHSREGQLPIQNAPLVGRGKLKDIYAYGAYDPVTVLPSGTTSPREPADDDEDEEQGFFSSQSAANNELRQIGDWNQRFQNAIQTIRGFSINTPLNERIEVNRDLIHLAQDFIYSSSTYGKIIISEVYMPDEKKMVKPLKLGMAGGDKYIVHNILFKFAVDSAGLYGSDYAAAKVAGHELKGLIQYFNTSLPELCVPLMALVDYGGFRLIAMSILPISEGTIIYGSNNSGVTIHKDNPQLNLIMKEAAQQLNIKEHLCGVVKASSNSLCAPADLEGHLGADGRFYLLDFSRTMPPERPKRGVKMAHLFRLLRPEFVKSYPRPLCSDAFSGFIKEHPGAEQLNNEVSEATDYLLRVGIALENFRLTEAIHRLGINVRHQGVIRKHVMDSDTKNLLMIDMCARVIKNKLRLILRNKMREVKAPVEEPYIRLVVSYLNLIFGSSDASEEYWSKTLRKAVSMKFDEGLTEEEQAPKYPFKCVLTNFSDDSVDGKFLLFARIQKMTGLHFGDKVNKDLSQNRNNWLPRGAKPLDDTDLEEIGIRVKHMNIIAHAQGYFYKTLGNVHYGSDPFSSKRFFALAMEKFEEALDTDPNNPDTLCNCVHADTPVTLASGVSMKVKDLATLPEILTLKGDVFVPAKPTAHLVRGRRECIELYFSDGRTLVCTPDHQILTTEGWCHANQLREGESRVLLGLDAPLYDPAEDEETHLRAFRLELAGDTFHMSDPQGIARAHALARLLGALYTGGSTSYNKTENTFHTSLNLGHLIDAAQVRADITLVVGRCGEVQKNRNIYRHSLPSYFVRALNTHDKILLPAGERKCLRYEVPALVMDPACPKSFVREFLGGLFGGDGHAPLPTTDNSGWLGVRFSMSKDVAVSDSLERFLADIKTLLVRFGITKMTIGNEQDVTSRHGDAKPKESDKTVLRLLWISSDEMIAFQERVGYRYCSHKQQRLIVAAAYFRAVSHSLKQAREQVVRVDAMSGYSDTKVEGARVRPAMPVTHAYNLVVTDVKKKEVNEQLALPRYDRVWEVLRKPPTLEDIGYRTGRMRPRDFLALADASSFFSEPRTERDNAQHRDFSTAKRSTSPPTTSRRKKARAKKPKDESYTASNEFGTSASEYDGSENSSTDDGHVLASTTPANKVHCGVSRSLHGFPIWTATFVRSKRIDGLQEVYDLTVPGTENFLASGITVHNCAQVFEKLSEEQYNVSKIRLAWADPKVQRANDYYQRALRAAPNDSYILYRYAQFFEKCQMEEQAEDFYLRSLEADPNNAACLQEYGNFLHEKELADEAEKFFMRASANTRQDARATALNPKAKGLRID